MIEIKKPTLAGRLFYYGLPFRRNVVLANIRTVFADSLTQAQQVQLAQAFYSHMASSLYENIRMRFMSLTAIKQCAIVKGHEKVLKAAGAGKGILLLTGHFGNWEFAPIAGIAQFDKFKGHFYFVRKMLKWKWLERWLFRRYYKAGLHVIPKKNSLNLVIDALEAKHAVVFVMDQHASIEAKDGIRAKFFGKPAGTYRSLATIASYTQTPVIPTTTYRQANGQHVLEFFDPIPWEHDDNQKQAIKKNTQAYNHALEKLILAHPEQWLWMHKRWKLADG